MKRVIKKGNDSRRATCSGCGCVFSYQYEDVVGSYVSCPECGEDCFHFGKRREDPYCPRPERLPPWAPYRYPWRRWTGTMSPQLSVESSGFLFKSYRGYDESWMHRALAEQVGAVLNKSGAD